MRLPPTILLALALLVPSLAASQSGAKPKESAFGFTKGMTLKQVQAVASVQKVPRHPWAYATTRPPAPVIFFATYAVSVSPKVGLCRVMATTKDMQTGSAEAKASIDAIFEALTKRYGRSTPVQSDDGISVGVWGDPLGPGTLIALSMSMDGKGTVSHLVNYYFSNYESCRAEEMQGL